MAQIINDPYASFGGGLGQVLGQSVGQGLNQGIQSKLESLLASKSLQKLGISPDKATAFANLPSSYRSELLKQGFLANLYEKPIMLKGKYQQVSPIQQPEQQTTQINQQPEQLQQQEHQPNIDQTGLANLQKLMEPQQQQTQEFQNPEVANIMKAFGMAPGQEGQPGNIPGLSEQQKELIRGKQPPKVSQQVVQAQPKMTIQQKQQELEAKPIEEQKKSFADDLGMTPKQTVKVEKTFARVAPKPKSNFSQADTFVIAAQDPATVKSAIESNPFIPAAQKTKWVAAQAKTQEKAQDRAFKIYEKNYTSSMKQLDKIKDSNKKYINTLEDEYKNIESQDHRIRMQVKFVNSGRLSEPWIHSLLDTLEHGIGSEYIKINLGNLHGYETKETQDYDKYHSQNTGSVAKTLGSRMTGREFDQAMKKYPSSAQSDDAKIDMFNALYYDEVLPKKLEFKAMKEIIKENGGEVPEDLKTLVNDRVNPILSAARKQYLETGNGEFKYEYKHGPIRSMLRTAARALVY
jgi:hypothetical protein